MWKAKTVLQWKDALVSLVAGALVLFLAVQAKFSLIGGNAAMIPAFSLVGLALGVLVLLALLKKAGTMACGIAALVMITGWLFPAYALSDKAMAALSGLMAAGCLGMVAVLYRMLTGRA